VGGNRNDRTHGLIHAGDSTAANHKTLDFSSLLEFLVCTARPIRGYFNFWIGLEPAELNGTKDQHLSENLGEDRTKLLSAELFAGFEGEKPATHAAFLAGDATNASRG
jgi:hypothetical protein